MPRISKARKQRLDAVAKARANNPCNNKNNSNVSLNDALIDTQLETTDHSETDTNLEDQIENYEPSDESDSDATPEINNSERLYVRLKNKFNSILARERRAPPG